MHFLYSSYYNNNIIIINYNRTTICGGK